MAGGRGGVRVCGGGDAEVRRKCKPRAVRPLNRSDEVTAVADGSGYLGGGGVWVGRARRGLGSMFQFGGCKGVTSGARWCGYAACSAYKAEREAIEHSTYLRVTDMRSTCNQSVIENSARKHGTRRPPFAKHGTRHQTPLSRAGAEGGGS